MTVIGALIREERKRTGKSQEEFAHFFRINQSTISRIEKGEDSIAKTTYEQILNSFGISQSINDGILTGQLNKLYQAISILDKAEAKKIIENIFKYQYLNVSDYLTKKIGYAFYDLFLAKGLTSEFSDTLAFIDNIQYDYNEEQRFFIKVLKSYYYFLIRDYKQAEKYIYETKMIMKLFFDEEHSLVNFLFARINIYLGNYNIAQLSLEEIKEINLKHNKYIWVYHTNRLLGVIYYLNSDYNEAINLTLSYLDNLYRIHHSEKDDNEALFIIASSYIARNDYIKASEYFKKLLASVNLEKRRLFTIFYLLTLKRSNYEEYLTYLKKVLDDPLFQEEVYRRLIASITSSNRKEGLTIFEKYFMSFFDINEDYLSLIYVKVLFSVIGKILWDERKYKAFHKLNITLLRRNGKELEDDL